MESAPSAQSESIRPISKNKPATVCNPPPRPPRRSSKCTSGRSGRVCAIHLLAQTRKVSNQSRIKQSSHVVQSTLWPSSESIKFTSRRSGLVCTIHTLAQTRKYQTNLNKNNAATLCNPPRSTPWSPRGRIKFTSRRSDGAGAIHLPRPNAKVSNQSQKTKRPRCAIHPSGPQVKVLNSPHNEVVVSVQSTPSPQRESIKPISKNKAATL